MRVKPIPSAEGFYAVFFNDFLSGVEAVRIAVQSGLRLSMLRLSDAEETETTLQFAGEDNRITWGKRGLRLIGYGEGRCLLIFGVSGGRVESGRWRDEASALFRSQGGLLCRQYDRRGLEKVSLPDPLSAQHIMEKGVCD